MPPIKRSMKSSFIWNFFDEKPESNKLATCNICKHDFSYQSTSNNLKKHMRRKHPLVKLDINRTDSGAATNPIPAAENINPVEVSEVAEEPQPSTSCASHNLQERIICKKANPIVAQTNVTGCWKRKMEISATKKIDDNLMLLFTHDYQPFSVVEDYGFRNFIAALNPSYQLPSRKTITNTLLPADFEEVYNHTRQLIMSELKSVTLTTDCWTSRNTENYLAVTAHFINSDFEIQNVLLECISFGESHTSSNLATELRRIIQDWDLEQKILMVISDNAANIKKAVKEELRLKHFGCYAHTINLIAQDALKHTSGILEKVKSIVGFFRRSTSAMAKFTEQQKQLMKEPKRLIQDVVTRWNSTYYMAERFTELEDPIRTTMALINKDLPIISMEEWAFLKEMVKILKPLESITKMMSAENYVTASSVIVLTDGLFDIYLELKRQDLSHLSKTVINSILQGISSRLGDLESSNSLTVTTFLDPRFKNIGFTNETVSERAKKAVLSLITNSIKHQISLAGISETAQDQDNVPQHTNPQQNQNSIWRSFDKKMASVQPLGTAQSRAIIEVQRYLEEPPISREEDPLRWWKNNAYNFPHLSRLVREKFITVATSVPCERLFSKSGQIVSDRRNRLSSTKVKQLLFLNCNKEAK